MTQVICTLKKGGKIIPRVFFTSEEKACVLELCFARECVIFVVVFALESVCVR